MRIKCKNCGCNDVTPMSTQTKYVFKEGIGFRADKNVKTNYSCNKCGNFFEGSFYQPNYSDKPALFVDIDFSMWDYEITSDNKDKPGKKIDNVNMTLTQPNSYPYRASAFGKAARAFRDGEVHGYTITARLGYDGETKSLKLLFNDLPEEVYS